jgi:Uma2 family endonuclease
MSTVAQKLITAEEFARMPNPPDGSRQELIQGVVVTMPPPGTRHGVCCLKIGRRVGGFVDDHNLGTVASNDSGFVTEKNPDTVRGADVAFWSRQRLPAIPEGYAEVAPELAVEVVSPEDHFSRVQRKLAHYLKCGVSMVWIVDPEDRSVSVYRPGQPTRILGESETLSGEDVLPGFSCVVGDLLL